MFTIYIYIYLSGFSSLSPYDCGITGSAYLGYAKGPGIDPSFPQTF